MPSHRILLTGGSGFLGSALLQGLLQAGHEVVCGGRSKPAGFGGSFLAFDLADPHLVERTFAGPGRFDIVIHAAGSLRTHCHEVNHLGTRNLLRALEGKTSRWIQMSSAGVYQNHHYGVIRETTPCEPQTEYEKSKLQADREALASSTNSVLLRPSMVAGRGMPGRPLRLLARCVQLGLRPGFTPRHILNLLHIGDVVDAVLYFCNLSVEIPSGSAFLLSDDLPYPEVMRVLEGDAGRRGLDIPASLLKSLALAGSAAGIAGFDSGTFSRLFNEARISSSLFQGLLPSWPKAGSIKAVREFKYGS